ncbi:uncharacterized protein PgNI_03880 [Pyricularia grisea]|uniref:Uncharacterized protein n=1 Tax=Pyricularia grisea TaxID=148305 RepID=A0A6P8BBR3_PYRGI|nr:uncharacterized protein PgNI_03880 [Pyricularia grisea]TLD13132.1 hypothetical protein PgNI_03880 [Pyricularia grisea]
MGLTNSSLHTTLQNTPPLIHLSSRWIQASPAGGLQADVRAVGIAGNVSRLIRQVSFPKGEKRISKSNPCLHSCAWFSNHPFAPGG